MKIIASCSPNWRETDLLQYLHTKNDFKGIVHPKMFNILLRKKGAKILGWGLDLHLFNRPIPARKHTGKREFPVLAGQTEDIPFFGEKEIHCVVRFPHQGISCLRPSSFPSFREGELLQASGWWWLSVVPSVSAAVFYYWECGCRPTHDLTTESVKDKNTLISHGRKKDRLVVHTCQMRKISCALTRRGLMVL